MGITMEVVIITVVIIKKQLNEKQKARRKKSSGFFIKRIPQSSTVAHVLRTDYVFFTTGIMPICFIF